MIGFLNNSQTEYDFRRIKDFKERIPNVLYKYRSFKKRNIDSIKNQEIYFATMRELDDPFDCLNTSKLSNVYNYKTKKLTSKAIDFLISKSLYKSINYDEKKDLKKIIHTYLYNPHELDFDSRKQKYQDLLYIVGVINDNFETIFHDTIDDGFEDTVVNPNDKIGIFSLSEVKDNKVMWSLYGDKYKGFCIEYEIPKEKEVLKWLFPAIYSRKSIKRFEMDVLEFISAIAQKNFCSLMEPLDVNECALYEPFCTKDTDWSFQKEWRLVGSQGLHKTLKIRNIYLGYDVSKYKTSQMIKLANDFGFGVYKMEEPNGSKVIRYKCIQELKK